MDANRAFCKANGVTKEFIIGKTAEELGLLLDPTVAGRIAEQLSLEGSIDREEISVRLLTGERRSVLFSTKVVTVSGRPHALSVFQDITERKEAEQKLRESEQRFQTIFNESPYSIVLNELPGGTFVDVNRHFCEANRVTKESVVGKTAEELKAIPNPDNPGWMKTKLLRDGRIDWEEMPMRRLTGEMVTGLISSRVITLAGKPYALTMVQDITERKRAETALQESERRFRTLFESAADALLLLKDNLVVDCNDSALLVFGCTKDDLLGQPYYRFSPLVQPDGRQSEEKALEKFQRALAGTPQFFEWKHSRHNETPFDAEVSFTRLEISGQPHLQAGVRDVTARKQTEEELRRLSIAIDQAAEEIMITGQDATIQYVNPAFEKITGYSRQEAIGQNARLLKSGVHEGDLSENLWATLDQGGVWSGRMTNKHKDGRLIHEDATISPLVNSRGELTGYVSLMKDVTEEVRLQAQLLQAQKMEAIGTLAGGVAHDFNNILMALMGYTSILQMKMSQHDPLRLYVDQIASSTGKAANITQSLLAFGRKQVMELRPHKVNEIVKDLEKMLRRLLPEDIELGLALTGDITVMADMTQIDQVLINLAVNARDAMPKGGRLHIETGQLEIDKEFRKLHGFGKSGRYAVISVSDTGMGMDEKTQEKIFEPFFTTKEPGKGTGLGLSIVYGIVKQHEGYVEVLTQPNKGTTFHIYLPEAKERPRERRAATRHVKGGTETILFAEDNPDIRKIAQEILAMGGYTVIAAVDGEDAVQKFIENQDTIKGLILDVVMPRKNGKEAYEEILKVKKNVKVLFMSGYTGDVVLDKGISDEGYHYISKPLAPEALLRKIREVLDR